jgi:hypothetical protein
MLREVRDVKVDGVPNHFLGVSTLSDHAAYLGARRDIEHHHAPVILRSWSMKSFVRVDSTVATSFDVTSSSFYIVISRGYRDNPSSIEARTCSTRYTEIAGSASRTTIESPRCREDDVTY